LKLEEILPAEINYTEKVDKFGGFEVFIPTVDGTFIPSAPSSLLKTGRLAKNVSAIIGWNEDDASLFTASPKLLMNQTALPEYLTEDRNLTSTQVREVLDLYPTNSSSIAASIARHPSIPPEWFIASQSLRDSAFACPGILMAQAMANHSAHVYLYDLNQTLFAPFLAANNASFEGVMHFSDIPYVFNQALAYNASQRTN
jgi:carboxylesterase type B